MSHSSEPAPSRTAACRFGIAALQLELAKMDNVDHIAAEVRTVASLMPWVRMVVVPELAALGPNPNLAQAMPGAVEQHFCALARDTGLWLIPGSIYEQRGDKVFNTAPIIDPTGRVVARYSKQFPFCPYEKGITPGNQTVVFDVPHVGRFGVSICYDMWFPETTRSLASMGAEVILHPTMTYTIDRGVELAIARSSAATNQCYFVDVNDAGHLGNGQSIVCGPGGEIIHQASIGREIIAFEVDLGHVRNVRERGWQCLGQPLKSFRDSNITYPAYAAGAAASDSLARLGELAVPGPGQSDTD